MATNSNSNKSNSAQDLNAFQQALQALTQVPDLPSIMQNIAEEAGPLVQKLIDDAASVQEGRDKSADIRAAHAKPAALWTDVRDIIVKVHELTENLPKQVASFIFASVMEPALKDERASTAKAYISTASRLFSDVLLKGVKDRDAIEGMTYAEAREILVPPKDRVLLDKIGTLTERLNFVARKAPKLDDYDQRKEDIHAALDRLAEAVEAIYNPVKQTVDANKKAAKAAREIEANRQQHPAEPAVTETTKPQAVASGTRH